MKKSQPRLWCFMDMLVGDDGKMVLTKVQAATFHALLAITVACVSWRKQDFIVEMWSLYAACAIGHAVIDKSAKQYQDFKNRKLDADSAPSETVESTTETKITSSGG